MFMLDNKIVSIDSEQIVNGIRYPHLRDPALREQLGIVEVADHEQYDQRFYWGVGNPKLLNDREEVDQDGNPMFVKVLDNSDPANPVMVDSTERLVTKGLKSTETAAVKAAAGSLLASTDWMVIRKVERNVDIPAAVAAYRAAVVAEADRLEAAIAAVTNVDALAAVKANWPKA